MTDLSNCWQEVLKIYIRIPLQPEYPYSPMPSFLWWNICHQIKVQYFIGQYNTMFDWYYLQNAPWPAGITMMGLMFWLPRMPGHLADDYDLFHFYWSYFNILIALQFGIFLRCQWWLKTKYKLTFDFQLWCLEFIKHHYSYGWTGRGVSFPNFIS